MTKRTTTVGQAKQGFRGVVVMTAATAALLGGVVLWQFRPADDAATPIATSHSRVSDGLGQVREPASRSHEEPRVQRSDAELYSGVPSSAGTTMSTFGWAELYAELQAGAGTGSATSVAVNSMRDMEEATTAVPVAVDTMGDMAELYRDQRAPAASVQERHTVYVVRSAEDATVIREYVASVRAASGQPPVAINMLVSDLEFTTLAQGVPQTPGTTYIDLRPAGGRGDLA